MAQVNRAMGAREAGWTGQIKRVLLAGVGVAFLAKHEVTDLVDRLVEKGATAERDGRKLVSGLLSQPTRGLTENGRRVIDLLGRRTRGLSRNVVRGLETAKGVTQGLTGNLGRTLSTRIERVLHTMNLVSKGDVDDLNTKIDRLAAKLDRLGKK